MLEEARGGSVLETRGTVCPGFIGLRECLPCRSDPERVHSRWKKQLVQNEESSKKNEFKKLAM